MASSDAVRATAIAREETRRSLDRMQFHLDRGPRGQRGVDREVRFLNALHRQTGRLGGVAVGQSVAVRAHRSFGDEALAALSTGDRRNIGRTKSSLLADFSADGLAAPRSIAQREDSWLWVSNASACPSCLDQHGDERSGPFVPMHPSCLCIAEPVDTPGVRPLSDEEMIAMHRQYGSPRYDRMMNQLETGDLRRIDVRGAEAINRRRSGARAVAEHDAKGVVLQNSIRGDIDDAVEEVIEEVIEDRTAIEIAQEVAEEAEEVLDAVKAYGRMAVEGSPSKAHLATIDEAERLIAEAMNSVDARFAKGLQLVADRIERAAVMKATTNRYKLNGLWEERGYKRGKGIIERRLSLQVNRANESYDDWVKASNAHYNKINTKRFLKEGADPRDLDAWELNPDYIDDLSETRASMEAWRRLNPEPKKIRAATAEEIADTYIHELAHVLDWTGEALSNMTPLRSKIISDGIGQAVNAAFRAGDEAFWYAKTKPGETIAELFRMYFMGDRHGAKTGTRSAAEWRAQYPELAEWVEENLLSKLDSVKKVTRGGA